MHTHTHTHTHNGILFSHKKEQNIGIQGNVDEVGDNYSKFSNSEIKNEILYILTQNWELSYENAKA